MRALLRRTNRVTALVAAFIVGIAAATFAASGPAVGAYSFGRHATKATGLGITAVNTTDGYTVSGGPNSLARYSAGPALDTDNGPASSGRVTFATRQSKAATGFDGARGTSTVTGFNLLAGKVTFNKVVAVAHSSVSGTNTQSDNLGSTIQNLKVNGVAIASPKGKTVPFKHNGNRIGRIEILKSVKTNQFGKTTMSTVGVKIIFEVAFSGFQANQTIQVAKSTSQVLCCGLAL